MKTRYRGTVAEQRRAGDWLTGVLTAKSDSRYPGERLGLPEQGPRSVARMGRRVAALFVDWLLSMVIAVAALHSQYWTIAIFAAEVWLLTATTGLTVGKRLRASGWSGWTASRWASAGRWSRTLLLLTVVPPLVTDGDLRGMHDRAANTVVVRI